MVSSRNLGGFTDVASSSIASANVANAKNNLSAMSQFKTAQTPDDIKNAAKKFEGMFIGQLMQMMFKTVPVDKEFGGGKGEETFRSFMVDEYGQQISNAGGIGIAKEIEKSLLAKQQAHSAATNDNTTASDTGVNNTINAAKAAAAYGKIENLN